MDLSKIDPEAWIAPRDACLDSNPFAKDKQLADQCGSRVSEEVLLVWGFEKSEHPIVSEDRLYFTSGAFADGLGLGVLLPP